MAAHDDDWPATMRRLARAVSPDEVLCLGALASTTLAQTGLRLRPIQPEQLLAGLHDLGRFDLAVVAGVLEQLPHRRGTALISRLRDVHAKRLLVQLALHRELDQGWTRQDMLGLGLSEVMRCLDAGRAVGLYHFNLYDYKLTPDWLNPQHWAHPHLWKP
jgi:hypothetical protein